MGFIYRLGLIIAGSYFEGAVRNTSQLVLYWIGKPDALQGFLPYLVPVFFGYVFALDVRSHWSDSRLKNDVMAYVGSTLLIGYPLLISLSLWFTGAEVDSLTARIRMASTVLFFANLLIAAVVWRAAVRRGFPLSMPWGNGKHAVAGEPEAVEAADPATVEKAGDPKEPVDAAQPMNSPEEKPQ